MRISLVALVLTALPGILTTTTLADEPTPDADSQEQIAQQYESVNEVLSAANDSGELPPGVVVRVDAHFWNESKKEGDQFSECWEFSAGEVHRVVKDRKDKKIVYRREKSSAFDASKVCRDLVEANILEIKANEGPGEPMGFAPIYFNRGHRSIELITNGKAALKLHEACLAARFKERHARAFATLYERLAAQARAEFTEFPARKTLLEAGKAGTWPREMVVRLGADVNSRDGRTLEEDWEFSEGQVHRIVTEIPEKGKVVNRREKSLKFDTKNICKDLTDGRAFEIATDKSLEDGLLLAGYEDATGGRYIEVLIDSKPALLLHEHCTSGGYGETHAREFAKLYETLAVKARIAFGETKDASPVRKTEGEQENEPSEKADGDESNSE